MAHMVDARDRLIGSATTAFAERGFHATTTRDIAAGAGMSPAAVYVHHASKEELLFLISLSGHDDALEVVRSAAECDGDAKDRLQSIVADFTAWHARNHTMARVVQYELAALAPEHLREVAVMRRQIEQVVRDAITDGVDAGVFDCDDVPGTALAMLSMAIDVARWFREDGRRSAAELGPLYGELALRMVEPRTSEAPRT
jgi:AcrR family transcriptional regulator